MNTTSFSVPTAGFTSNGASTFLQVAMKNKFDKWAPPRYYTTCKACGGVVRTPPDARLLENYIQRYHRKACVCGTGTQNQTK